MPTFKRKRSADTAPIFRSCQVSPLPQPRCVPSRPDSSFSSPECSSASAVLSPLLLSGDIGSELKTERCFERKWNVSEEWMCLPRVPPLYVLGATKTAVKVGNNSSPAHVAHRIGDCLRLLSLDPTFNQEQATALATSFDGVEFFVRLFRHASERKTIVEVQRRRGSALRFHRLARAVLRAARGEMTTSSKPGTAAESARKLDAPPRPSPTGRSPLLGSSARPASLSRQLPRPQLSAPPMAATQDPDYGIEAALETVEDLVRKDRTDAQELGMESLALLTDEKSSGSEKALGVARVLLLEMGGTLDGDVEAKYNTIRQKIIDLIAHRRAEVDEEEEMNHNERRHLTSMHRLAMMALGNSLAILSRTCPAVLANLLAGQAGLLPALMEDVEGAEQSPHDAALAVRCLSALLGSGAAAMMACKAANEDIREKLATARGVGRCRHSMLERESERALLRLL